MNAPIFDLLNDRNHPCLTVVIGMTGHGKSVTISSIMARWRAAGLGASLAVDGVAPDPPDRSHIAYWADAWCAEPPEVLPAGTTLLACDEVWRYVGQAKGQHPIMREMVLLGRHRGVSTLYGTQRAIHMHPDIWSQARRVIIHRTMVSHDLARIGELDRMTGQHLDIIRALPKGYAVIWDFETGVWVPDVPEWRR